MAQEWTPKIAPPDRPGPDPTAAGFVFYSLFGSVSVVLIGSGSVRGVLSFSC